MENYNHGQISYNGLNEGEFFSQELNGLIIGKLKRFKENKNFKTVFDKHDLLLCFSKLIDNNLYNRYVFFRKGTTDISYAVILKINKNTGEADYVAHKHGKRTENHHIQQYIKFICSIHQEIYKKHIVLKTEIELFPIEEGMLMIADYLNKQKKTKKRLSDLVKLIERDGCSCRHKDCCKIGVQIGRYRDVNGGIHYDLYTQGLVLMTIDHIHPKSKGGRNILANYQLLCSECNIAKGAKIMDVTK